MTVSLKASMVPISTHSRRSRPTLSDPVIVFGVLALALIVYLHGWRPAPWPASLGALAAILLIAGRIAREFRFARWTDAALRDIERHYCLLADCGTDVIVEFGPGLRAVYVSASSRVVLGHPPHELLGRHPQDFVHPQDGPALSDYLAGIAAGERLASLTCRGPARDGADIRLDVTGRTIAGRKGLAVSLRDVTRQLQAEMLLDRANNHLQRLMMLDDVTGLANRRCFDVVLHKECRRAARTRRTLALLLVEMDRFDSFNDIYGPSAGDVCLRAMGAALAHQIGRPADLAARFSGEVFAILLAETDQAGALEVAERIREAVRLLGIVHCGSPDRVLTVSIGAAVILPDQRLRSAETLIEVARAALSRAAATGGDSVVPRIDEHTLRDVG